MMFLPPNLALDLGVDLSPDFPDAVQIGFAVSQPRRLISLGVRPSRWNVRAAAVHTPPRLFDSACGLFGSAPAPI